MIGDVQGECNHSFVPQIFVDCLLHALKTVYGGVVLRELTLPWKNLALGNESLYPILLSVTKARSPLEMATGYLTQMRVKEYISKKEAL